MTRYYCDQCAAEIPEGTGRLRRKYGKIKIEIITGTVGGAWNEGIFCDDCVKKAVAIGDESKESL